MTPERLAEIKDWHTITSDNHYRQLRHFHDERSLEMMHELIVEVQMLRAANDNLREQLGAQRVGDDTYAWPARR